MNKKLNKQNRPKLPTKKQVYELWWEYLKQNSEYKKYCQKAAEGNSKMGKDREIFWYEMEPNFRKDNPDPESFYVGWRHFGNVHSDSFENWWRAEIRAERDINPDDTGDPISQWWPCRAGTFAERDVGLPDDPYIPGKEPIRYYGADCFARDFDFCTKRIRGGNPSAYEAKKTFIGRMKKLKPMIFLVEVNLDGDPQIDDLKNLFSQIVRTQRNRLPREGIPWETPTRPLYYDQVKRYLKIFKYRKQRVKWSVVCVKICGKWTKNIENTLMAEKRKAERIIENVGRGYFPGKYEA